MRKKLLSILTLAIVIAFGACSTEEIMQGPNPGTNPGDGHTMTLTASMPGEPATRVGLEQQADKTIALTWEVGDKVQLAFVQEGAKVKQTITLTAKDITNNGKKAIFDIVLPEASTGFDETKIFDIYGVCGGGKKTLGVDLGVPGDGEAGQGTITSFYSGDALVLGDAHTNPYIKLPTFAGSAQSLENIHFRKDVILTFTAIGIDASYPQVSVMFNHLGSLFSVNIKNTGSESLDNLQQAQIVGVNNADNQNWAYNSASGGKTYDLVTQKFINTDDASNYLSLKAATSTLEAGASTIFWAWYPPLPEVKWPALKIKLIKTNNSIVGSANALPARNNPTAAGKAYYFYATWDGNEVNFTNEEFNNDLTVDVAEMGSLNTLLSATQKSIVAKLTVTGQINEDDFLIMSNGMPALKYLDLSQVTCKDNKIPSYAFAGKGLRSIILPESNTTIGESAFAHCAGLVGDLTIPANVTTIGESAFAHCHGFTGSLTLPDALTMIGAYAFYDCFGFTGDLVIPASVTTIGEYAFTACHGFTGTLTLPNGLSTIGEGVFGGCYGFTGSLKLPDRLETIGNYAFVDCDSFTGTIVFPSTLSSIGSDGFDECSSITAFQFPHTTPIPYEYNMLTAGKPVEVPGSAIATYQVTDGWSSHAIKEMYYEYALNVTNKGSLSTLLSDTQKTIITKLTLTGQINKADYDVMKLQMPNLKIVDLSQVTSYEGETVNKIPAGAFGDENGDLANEEITSIILPTSATSIGNNAFDSCYRLTGDLILPAGLITVGRAAFYQCSGFTGALTIPDKVTTIGNLAFAACGGLNGSLFLSAALETIGNAAFNQCSGFTGALIIPDKVTTIGNDAFNKCGFTGSLTLPEGLRTIGGSAFNYCSKITGTIVFPSTLSSIGSYGFDECSSITAFQFLNPTPIDYTTNMLDSEKPVKVPVGTVDEYKRIWGEKANRHTITGD